MIRQHREAMRYRFEQFELDLATYRLSRRGTVLHLQPKVLDLLVYLLERRARMVKKQELLEALWPDVTVGESSLTRAMSELRRNLDDAGETQRIIETIRGRGYRFVADVEEVVEAPAGVTGEHPPRPPPAPRRTEGQRLAVGAGPLPGRTRELDTLDSWLSDARTTRIALVAGAPGVGKTRIANEAAARAEERRVRPVRVSASSDGGDGAPMLREIIRAVLDAAAPDELQRAVSRLTELGTANAREERVSEFTDLLDEITRGEPTLFVIDDLHALGDPALETWLAVASAARPARARWLATYAESAVTRRPALARVVATAVADHGALLVPLGGLEADAVAAILAERTGAPPEAALVEEVLARTGGNALYVTHLAGAIATVRMRPRGPGALVESIQLSPASVAVLTRHLDAVSKSCADVLGWMAVLGYDTDLAILAAVVARPPAELLEPLGEALASSIVQKRERPGAYAFAQALTRDLVYKRLPDDERARRHARACEALLALHGAAVELHIEEIATHALQGAAIDGARRAVDLAERAAAAATERGEHASAAWFLARAVQVHALEARDDARAAELALALGEARVRADERAQAAVDLERAALLASAIEGGDVERRALERLSAIGALRPRLASRLEALRAPRK